MNETNENMNMKAWAFSPSDVQGVDLHPAKSKIKAKAKKTRLASLNVGTLKGKTRELASMLNKRKVDIACIQETKWKGQKTLMIGDGSLKDVIDCKFIPGEDIAVQHKLLVMDLHITIKSTQNKIKLEPCIKWDDKTNYKKSKRIAKKAVARAKAMPYDDMYEELHTKEGQNKIYRLAKQREMNSRVINGAPKVIKNKDGKLIIKEKEIINRWKEYFQELLNFNPHILHLDEHSPCQNLIQ
ncbi:uncharacterized protein LOC135927095 [Gordionus sp. m RMFG-2023]|uniref:uncharacterized protein LOC135927095 n=1 Tax=Gordionus sp. m RMFG-2023 TaxID=3053472 RepID=UPI0031FD8F92